MLYTIVPLERVYSNTTRSLIDDYMVQALSPVETETQYIDIPIAHGSLSARRQGDKYIVNQIKSTDMSSYLNEMYAPGKEIDISHY